MAVKITEGQICDGSISKICVTRSTPYMENFIIVSKSAQLLHYAALLNNEFLSMYISVFKIAAFMQ